MAPPLFVSGRGGIPRSYGSRRKLLDELQVPRCALSRCDLFGWREVVPLRAVAAELTQTSALAVGLDALRGHDHAQCVGHVDGGGHDGVVGGAAPEPAMKLRSTFNSSNGNRRR